MKTSRPPSSEGSGSAGSGDEAFAELSFFGLEFNDDFILALFGIGVFVVIFLMALGGRTPKRKKTSIEKDLARYRDKLERGQG